MDNNIYLSAIIYMFNDIINITNMSVYIINYLLVINIKTLIKYT